MSVELPKDAEGREIPLDVAALYDKNCNRVEVFRWNYVRGRNNNWTFNLLSEYTNVPHYPQDYYLTPPDSWEKLEEDLSRGKDICDYFEECPKEMDGKSCSECKKAALKNIASRIRKLRGESE